ncbi:type I IFN inhibitor [Hypsugopox virus]|nr:type I IFN inhibitor [Hypsugopox virus]
MGISHQMDVHVYSENLSIIDTAPKKGDYYGVELNFTSIREHDIIIVIIIYPDWSEVNGVKPLVAVVNDEEIVINKVYESLHKVVFTCKFTVIDYANVKIYSKNDEHYIDDKMCPEIDIDIDLKEFNMIKEGFTYSYAYSPITTENKKECIKALNEYKATGDLDDDDDDCIYTEHDSDFSLDSDTSDSDDFDDVDVDNKD